MMRSRFSVSRYWMARIYRFPVSVTPRASVAAAIILLTIPCQWSTAWLTVVMLHEVLHCVAVWACGGRIYSVHIDLPGAQIRTTPLSSVKEIACLLAGPLGTMGLLAFSKRFPCLSVCALLQSVYNLLPFPNLDGGQVLLRITGFLFSEDTSVRFCNAVCWITLFLIICICLYGAFFLKLGLSPIFLSAILFLRHGNIKIPCKQRCHRVQ